MQMNRSIGVRARRNCYADEPQYRHPRRRRATARANYSPAAVINRIWPPKIGTSQCPGVPLHCNCSNPSVHIL